MKFIEKIKEWYKDYIYENLITSSNKFSQEADSVVSKFLEKVFTVTIDENISPAYMFLISGDLILNVWIENRWYSFAHSIVLVKDIDIRYSNNSYALGLRGIGNGGEVVFERRNIRVSRKNFETLKKIYLENAKPAKPPVDYTNAMEVLNGKV